MNFRKSMTCLVIVMGLAFFQLSITIGNSEPANLNAVEFPNYKFIAFGDTREAGTDNSGWESVSSLINDLVSNNDIKFILHSGDIVDYGADQADWDDYWYPEYNKYPKISVLPWYFVAGNHEYNQRAGGMDLELTVYLENVENPGNELYYSFDSPQGDTHFICLNCEYYFNDNNKTRQDLQTAWLEDDFANNKIDRIIVMFHRPLWGANPTRIATEYQPLRAEWHDYFIEEGVDQVFNGHDHMFLHTIRNGTHYTISGGGTASMVKPIINHPDVQKEWQDTDVAFTGYHVCLVEATKDGFNVDVVMANGTIAYEYSVSAAVPDDFVPKITSSQSEEGLPIPGFELQLVVIGLIVAGWIIAIRKKK